MRRPSDTQSTLAPTPTVTISEYWSQSPPDDLRREIAWRMADPGAKLEVVKAISNERLEFRTIWNRSLPMNQLPYELLIQIFMGVHWEFDPASEFSMAWRQGPQPSFSKLLGICRHWRDIIIGTPAFWSTVNLKGNVNWTELCLARSLTAAIGVWARVPRPCYPDRLRVAYPLVHRIRSLYFQSDARLDNPERDLTFPLLFGNGIPVLPVLEKLNFAITHSLWPSSQGYLPIDVEVTLRRFPCLRSLTLGGIVAPQDTALYMQLRTLSLTTCSHRLSFDHFLDTLALCTRLERLCLRDTLDRFSDDWIQRDPVLRQPLISFPRLDTLKVSGHGAACTSRFLAYIHIQPSTIHLEIFVQVDARSPDDRAFTIAAMLHAATLEPLATVNDLEILMRSCAGPRSVWIRMNRTPERVVAASLIMDVAVSAHDPSCDLVRYAPADYYGRGSVGDLVESLGRSPVTSLSVVNVYPDTVAAWAAVFRTFPLLERLSIRAPGIGCEYAVGIQNIFLGLHAASTTGPGPPAVACPNLRHVSVDGSGSPAVYEAICTCIGHRGGRGVVLGQLDLSLYRDWDFSSALCPAPCIKDIVGCTERLSLRGVNFVDGRLEDGATLGAAETDPGE
ncbi:hypothetical protein LXA43DRAFT_197487 [Ganoderma leucocontextum]|nr:hypothetical protein LXA43DRAFT_197487 [Ganoderma leucocontextum]